MRRMGAQLPLSRAGLAPRARAGCGRHASAVSSDHRWRAPGGDHGADTDADGIGVVNEHVFINWCGRPAVRDHSFEIRFLSPGVQVFAFTFG